MKKKNILLEQLNKIQDFLVIQKDIDSSMQSNNNVIQLINELIESVQQLYDYVQVHDKQDENIQILKKYLKIVKLCPELPNVDAAYLDLHAPNKTSVCNWHPDEQIVQDFVQLSEWLKPKKTTSKRE